LPKEGGHNKFVKKIHIMNTTTSKKVTVLIMSLVFLMYSSSLNAATSIKEWYGNQNFSFSETQSELNISVNKNPWESFTVKIDNFELLNNPLLSLLIKSDQDIVLRIDISDGVFVSSQTQIIEQGLTASESFTKMNFDFSQVLSDINLSEDTYLLFLVNPGKKFEGQISIKDIKLLKDTSNQNTTTRTDNSEIEQGLSIFPSPAVDYTFVTIPEGDFLSLNIYNISGNEIISIDASYFSGSEYKLNLSDIVEGYYIVKLVSHEKTFCGKFIKN